jgi:hypothetical protein
MSMKIYLHDHRSGNDIASISKQEIYDVCREINAEIVGHDERFMADLWLLHSNSIDKYLDPQDVSQQELERDQVLIFVTTTSGLSSLKYEHQVLDINGSRRALLFVKDMSILQKKRNLKNLCSLSFSNAETIIRNHSAYNVGWEEDPFYIYCDFVIAIYILCQLYLHLNDLEKSDLQSKGHLTKVELSSWWKKSMMGDHSSWDRLKSEINGEGKVSVEKAEACHLAIKAILSKR